MTKEKESKKNILSRKQGISLIILTIILIIFFIYIILSGTNFIVALLVILFLFLFFFGLIYKGSELSVSSNFGSSRNEKKTSRDRSKERYKGDIPQKDIPESLNFTYHRPLIRKCPKCRMILTRNMKKCPNCQKSFD